MAKKQPLIERFQQLAGIKPLYTEQLGPRMSNPRPTGPSEPGPFDDSETTVGDEMEKWLDTEPFDDEDLRLYRHEQLFSHLFDVHVPF